MDSVTVAWRGIVQGDDGAMATPAVNVLAAVISEKRRRTNIDTGGNNDNAIDGGSPGAGGNGNTVVRQRDGGITAPGSDANMRRSRSFGEHYIMEKRGWMMMVAALFVQMVFQAALQPPTWIPADWFQQMLSYEREHGAVALAPAPSTITGRSAPSPSPHHYGAPAESPAAAIILTKDQAHKVWVYVVFNTLTFATALTILLILLLMNRSSSRLIGNKRGSGQLSTCRC
uniref:PGG domain-containing protein n=1 Tax=Oryza punctata TaxID=4537 RepID=A0A0E0KYZ0_ORYPU